MIKGMKRNAFIFVFHFHSLSHIHKKLKFPDNITLMVKVNILGYIRFQRVDAIS